MSWAFAQEADKKQRSWRGDDFRSQVRGEPVDVLIVLARPLLTEKWRGLAELAFLRDLIRTGFEQVIGKRRQLWRNQALGWRALSVGDDETASASRLMATIASSVSPAGRGGIPAVTIGGACTSCPFSSVLGRAVGAAGTVRTTYSLWSASSASPPASARAFANRRWLESVYTPPLPTAPIIEIRWLFYSRM